MASNRAPCKPTLPVHVQPLAGTDCDYLQAAGHLESCEEQSKEDKCVWSALIGRGGGGVGGLGGAAVPDKGRGNVWQSEGRGWKARGGGR